MINNNNNISDGSIISSSPLDCRDLLASIQLPAIPTTGSTNNIIASTTTTTDVMMNHLPTTIPYRVHWPCDIVSSVNFIPRDEENKASRVLGGNFEYFNALTESNRGYLKSIDGSTSFQEMLNDINSPHDGAPYVPHPDEYVPTPPPSKKTQKEIFIIDDEDVTTSSDITPKTFPLTTTPGSSNISFDSLLFDDDFDDDFPIGIAELNALADIYPMPDEYDDLLMMTLSATNLST